MRDIKYVCRTCREDDINVTARYNLNDPVGSIRVIDYFCNTCNKRMDFLLAKEDK